MRRFLFLPVLVLGLGAGVALAQMTHTTEIITDFLNGVKVGSLNGLRKTATGTLTLGGTDVTTMLLTASTGLVTIDANGERRTPPATQTIAAGGIIAADACGGVKNITAAGAVTTDTTNSVTAPAAANTNCRMVVCNVGAQTITIDKNANILLQGGADVALLANSCVGILSNGTTWRQIAAQQTAT